MGLWVCGPVSFDSWVVGWFGSGWGLCYRRRLGDEMSMGHSMVGLAYEAITSIGMIR